VLVSETMLQQTQVATVTPYFQRFIGRYPTLADLATADQQQVLQLWQGLGYYSRASNLLKAAQKVLADFNCRIPQTVPELLSLPGVGRYTAGAIASLAFGRRQPILDGNVIRVLCRIDAIENDPSLASTRGKLWQRAEEILPRTNAADFNSALMELGATVCTPRIPACQACPVRLHCQAHALRIQDRLPVRTPRKVRPIERRWIFCIAHAGRFLIEQRPAKGRWAGLWQFVTLPANGEPAGRILRSAIGLQLGRLRPLGRFIHDLTHRQYEFQVYRCTATGDVADVAPRVWISPGELADYPLPQPHLRAAKLLLDPR
jgi:A/G-specific adenine glycosylase